MTADSAQKALEVDGRTLAYRDVGAGTPVVLVHSGGFSGRQWRRLGDALAPTHRSIIPDLLGYGASSEWPAGAPFHFRLDLAALEALVLHLGQPVHLVGHSYGGFLALQAALAHPSLVKSLAVFEPVAFGVLEPEDWKDSPFLPSTFEGTGEAWLSAFVSGWNGPGAWDALNAETQQAFRKVGWKVYQEVITLSDDRTTRERYGTIAAPTLLLGGARTPAFERRVLERLSQVMPRTELQVFEGMGHMGPITHGPDVNAAILRHVRAWS
ncbi:alpha/beta hydrolase [Comamonas sp. JC664]|uniref:alpha/beta fold hydrolase n=1 Tax=Comamonas sp. JC664 TaxID=2801917 RepID=UPI00174E36D0|nr:alpha/beta hydrolase [Comamonas sp. JC664]MBL0692986.1 alpha/beta hydrolase [Comamonas sp. JC664]GHG91613.1 alpha/beta hydrolase [Comamonas sp. KCTC 72670]